MSFMNYYSDFNISSSFRYGVGHIKKGSLDLIRNKPPTKKLSSIGEIAFGFTETLPPLGVILANADKKVRNSTLKARIRQRDLFVKQQIKSGSFALQELYFDTSSSKLRGKRYLGLSKTLDNCSPDRQIYSLIKDLKKFIDKIPCVSRELANCLKTLKEAKEFGLIISCIISSSSIDEKNQFKQLLKNTIKNRLEDLVEDDYLLIPCGYMNGNIYDLSGVQNKSVNGHSMLMKVAKKPGTYEVTVFNTGDGFKRHIKDKAVRQYLPNMF